MKALSKDNDDKYRRMFRRDAFLLLAIIIITALGVGFTLFLAAKGIID